MAESERELNLYNRLLLAQAINYRRLGYSRIKVNHKNYLQGQPMKIGGYIPDITAVWEENTVLCEVVTDDTMIESEIVERWRAFNRSGYGLQMIIPKLTLGKVKDFTRSNGICVDKYWYSNCG